MAAERQPGQLLRNPPGKAARRAHVWRNHVKPVKGEAVSRGAEGLSEFQNKGPPKKGGGGNQVGVEARTLKPGRSFGGTRTFFLE